MVSQVDLFNEASRGISSDEGRAVHHSDFWNVVALSDDLHCDPDPTAAEMPLTFSLAAGTSAYSARVVQVIEIRHLETLRKSIICP